MKTGPDGLALIRKNEGCKLVAYLDKLAKPPVPTIGYGCTGPDIHMGMVITQVVAEQMLLDRLAREFEPGVMGAIGSAPVHQLQFDAMVSLTWNIGLGRYPDDPRGPAGFRGSSVLRHHREGNYHTAAIAFSMWNKSGGVVRPGLVRRRAEEAALYLRGSPGPVIHMPPTKTMP